jgi:hypothetical protein
MGTMKLPNSEAEDFKAVLSARNLLPDDFELSFGPTEIAAPAPRIGAAINAIVVRSRRTGAVATYERGGLDVSTSPLVRWVRELAHDLDSGALR